MKRFISILLVAALAASVAHAQSAPAAPGATDDAMAMMLLGAIDVPLTPDAIIWSGLTAEKAAAVAVDETRGRYLRVRAVSALGVLGGADARRLIETLAVGDTDPQVRVQSVISLSRVWGTDDRPTVEAFLVERLVDPSPAVDSALTRELARLRR